MGDYFSAEGYIMLDNENFPLSLLHFCNLHFKNLSLSTRLCICARPIVQTLKVKAKMSANGATRPGECCCVGVGVVIVIIHIAA